jgi:hypothetical protein
MSSLLQNTVFGRSKVNTYIGGVANLYNTKELLAVQLYITSDRISNFTINGNDVSCLIKGSYTPNVFTDITQITYFDDRSGLVNYFRGTHYYFRGCTNLKYVNFPNLKSIGPSAFGRCINLEYVNLPKLEIIDSLATNDGITIFETCNKLTELNFPLLSTFYSNAALSGLTGLKLLNIPNCTVLGKTTANNSFFNNIRMGLIINCNSYLQTSNAGTPDGDLQYAITSRGAIVNYI